MPSQLPPGKQQYFDNAGVPLVGGKLFTYTAGTTAPKATYADAAGTVPNANPVVLDSRGEALIFWNGTYKVVLQDALGNVIWTVDNIAESGLGSRTSSTGSVIVPVGTTAQRDVAPSLGYMRWNADLGCYESYNGGAWKSVLKTINGTAIPDGGDALIKTVGGTSLVGAGDVAVQAPLVSGTNIKTVNGVNVLGAGNLPISSSLARSARTANAILTAADASTLIDITSGTFTQTFTAAATLGSAWFCYIRNSGTGVITIPSSDGVANWPMYPGEVRLFQCDGVNFNSVVLNGYKFTATTSGTWTKPPGYNYHRFLVIGAGAGGDGGGGGGASSGANGGLGGGGGGGGSGGAAGQPVEAWFASAWLPASATFAIGAGGVGGAGNTGMNASGVASGSAYNGFKGLAGGTTTFGSPTSQYYMSAPGGGAGTASGANGGGSGGASASYGATGGAGNPNPTQVTIYTATWNTTVIFPTTLSVTGNTGGTGTTTTAGNGGQGGAGALSVLTGTAVPGGNGGAGSYAAVGGAGVTPAAPVVAGVGGGGGGGGGGTGNVAQPGGAGGQGGTGGTGYFEAVGVI